MHVQRYIGWILSRVSDAHVGVEHLRVLVERSPSVLGNEAGCDVGELGEINGTNLGLNAIDDQIRMSISTANVGGDDVVDVLTWSDLYARKEVARGIQDINWYAIQCNVCDCSRNAVVGYITYRVPADKNLHTGRKFPSRSRGVDVNREAGLAKAIVRHIRASIRAARRIA